METLYKSNAKEDTRKTAYVYRTGGGTPLYKPYRYVLHQRVRFLRRFCLKTGIDFAHFGNRVRIGEPGGTPLPRIPRSIPRI